MSLANVRRIMHNSGAALDFDQSGVAVRRNAGSPINGRSGFNMQKSFRQESACLTGQQSAFFSGFFSSKAAASDATDNAPKWASCTENIGRRMPLGASLANLVEVSQNLSARNIQM